MAYGKRSESDDIRIVAQNAGTTAAAIYNALVANSGDTEFDAEKFNAIRREVFEGSMRLGQGSQAVTVEDVAEKLGATVEDDAPQSSGGGPGGVTINFGKHKGKTLAEVEAEAPDYLDWVLDNSNNDFIVKAIRKYRAA